MKCPVCVEQGLKSTMRSLGMTKTLVYYSPWYDQEGVYHSHDGNRIEEGFECSNKHITVRRHHASCPAGDFDTEDTGLVEFKRNG